MVSLQSIIWVFLLNNFRRVINLGEYRPLVFFWSWSFLYCARSVLSRPQADILPVRSSRLVNYICVSVITINNAINEIKIKCPVISNAPNLIWYIYCLLMFIFILLLFDFFCYFVPVNRVHDLCLTSLLCRHSLGSSRNFWGGRLCDEPKECLRRRLVFGLLSLVSNRQIYNLWTGSYDSKQFYMGACYQTK